MNINCKPTTFQQKNIVSHAHQLDSTHIFNLLTGDVLFEEIESLLPKHRERFFPPTETLSMFITQALSADKSCQKIVNDKAINQCINGLTLSSTHTGGYCRARQRLPLEMVTQLTRFLGSHIEQQSEPGWLWQDRHIKVVDGTTVTMPDTALNQVEYPQQSGQKEGLGFPICRLVGVTSLSSGALLDLAVGYYKGKGGDEQTLLRSMQDGFTKGDLLLGDAYYPTYFFLADMRLKGVDLLMEQNGSRRKTADFKKGKSLGTNDHIFTSKKPKKRPCWMSQERYDAMVNELQIREFKVGKKILVTTLMNSKTYPSKALNKLYKSRWNIELDIRNIKTTMGMDILSCKTPEMALKEIWVYCLAYNLIRLLMLQSALLSNIIPRQISFKHSLQVGLTLATQTHPLSDEMMIQFLVLIAQQTVGHRPGRVEPRALKRRQKHFPLLTKPRGQARQDIMTNGHAKKLK